VRTLGIVAKGIVAANLAFFWVAARLGMREALLRLSKAYDALLAPSRPPLQSVSIRGLANHYCSGHGLEVGPGRSPICEPENAKFLDKYPGRHSDGVAIDYVCEAFDIPVPESSFDFLVSAHTLEHLPDPLRALNEWRRVVRNGGVLFLVLPHCARTYDAGRPVTQFSHHLADFEKGVGFEDTTHFEEFERISIPAGRDHTWLSDPDCRKPDGKLNWDWIVSQGVIHYHVWTQSEIVDLLRYIGCPILFVLDEAVDRSDSFVVVGRVVK
jgi:SAM-dependent methyltransferase